MAIKHIVADQMPEIARQSDEQQYVRTGGCCGIPAYRLRSIGPIEAAINGGVLRQICGQRLSTGHLGDDQWADINVKSADVRG